MLSEPSSTEGLPRFCSRIYSRIRDVEVCASGNEEALKGSKRKKAAIEPVPSP